jgi:monoterpene epsilon-lactone hydrolase
MTCRSVLGSTLNFLIVAGVACLAPATASQLRMSSSGAITIPAIVVPSSRLMSSAGNESRIEHISLARRATGLPAAKAFSIEFSGWADRMRRAFPVVSSAEKVAGVPVIVYQPRAGVAAPMSNRVLINVHGGGFRGCFEECGAMESIPVAALTRARVISIDYREGPGVPMADAIEDIVRVYRDALTTHSPQDVVLYGCSAGGFLTVQTLVWFAEHHVPMPAAAGVFCAGIGPPGDSWVTGSMLGNGQSPSPLPSAGGALGHIFATPSRAVLAKFPPTLVITGTRDMFLSNAVYLDTQLESAGVHASLHVWEGGRHAFFYDVRVPEAQQAYSVMGKFFVRHLQRSHGQDR